MSQAFIEQTARDYDLPIYVVEKIAKLYPESFYEELELFIKNRCK